MTLETQASIERIQKWIDHPYNQQMFLSMKKNETKDQRIKRAILNMIDGIENYLKDVKIDNTNENVNGVVEQLNDLKNYVIFKEWF